LRGITKEDHYSMHTESTSVLAFAPRSRSWQHRRAATCVRVGLAVAIACAPVTVALAQSPQNAKSPQTSSTTQTRQNAGQRQAAPGRLVVPVSATLAGAETPSVEAGTSAVTGTFAIQRFARTTDDAVAAVGTLTLTVTDASTTSTRAIITQAAMPVARSTGIATPAPAVTASPSTGPTTTACETVRLVLDAIEIAPMGVAVEIARVNVDVTALPGVGERLPTLLCEVANQISGTTAPAELVTTLNGLLDMLG
jgi:hypothetical protein